MPFDIWTTFESQRNINPDAGYLKFLSKSLAYFLPNSIPFDIWTTFDSQQWYKYLTMSIEFPIVPPLRNKILWYYILSAFESEDKINFRSLALKIKLYKIYTTQPLQKKFQFQFISVNYLTLLRDIAKNIQQKRQILYMSVDIILIWR